MNYETYRRADDRKKYRQEQAIIRQVEYDALSPESKLELLDKRLGTGIGAKKQRTKLA